MKTIGSHAGRRAGNTSNYQDFPLCTPETARLKAEWLRSHWGSIFGLERCRKYFMRNPTLSNWYLYERSAAAHGFLVVRGTKAKR